MNTLFVFTDCTAHPLSFLLKPGFRHVFVALRRDDYWIVVDSTNGLPFVSVAASAEFDLAGFYRGYGYTVLEAEIEGKSVRAPFVAASCVGLAKVMTGFRSRAFTPYRLYRALKRRTP